LAEFAEVGIQLPQVVQQVARMVQQGVAGRCQLDALGLAIEQADAELALQVADALAHRRQGEVLALGGAGQAALVGDGGEQAQGDEIDTTHRALPYSQVAKDAPFRPFTSKPRQETPSRKAKRTLAIDQLSASLASVMLCATNQPA